MLESLSVKLNMKWKSLFEIIFQASKFIIEDYHKPNSADLDMPNHIGNWPIHNEPTKILQPNEEVELQLSNTTTNFDNLTPYPSLRNTHKVAKWCSLFKVTEAKAKSCGIFKHSNEYHKGNKAASTIAK